MEIKLYEISVRDVFDGYENNESTGQVIAYGGALNVRPAYQREFVYDDKKKKAVMNSILHEFPLNVMYWSDNGDGTYEMLDGQQRTISICDWLDNGYSIFANPNSPLTPYYAHTSKEITEQVLDYKLMIYICKGTDTEKLDWFKIINIAGEIRSDLRDVEESKIECARRHFASISGSDVRFEIITSYDKLYDMVTK